VPGSFWPPERSSSSGGPRSLSTQELPAHSVPFFFQSTRQGPCAQFLDSPFTRIAGHVLDLSRFSLPSKSNPLRRGCLSTCFQMKFRLSVFCGLQSNRQFCHGTPSRVHPAWRCSPTSGRRRMGRRYRFNIFCVCAKWFTRSLTRPPHGLPCPLTPFPP